MGDSRRTHDQPDTSPASVTVREPTVREVSRVIAAGSRVVYAAVSDVVRTAEHSEEIVEIHWLERARPESVSQGDTFEARNETKAMRWSSRSIVTDAQPGRRFAFAVSNTDHPTATWSYELEPHLHGTSVRYRVQLGDGPSMFEHVTGGDASRRAGAEESRLDALAGGMGTVLDRLAAELGERPAAR